MSLPGRVLNEAGPKNTGFKVARIPVEPRILHISIKKTSKRSAPYLPHKTDIYPSLDSAAVAFAPYIATKLKTHIPTPRPAMRAPENPKPPVNYSSTLI